MHTGVIPGVVNTSTSISAPRTSKKVRIGPSRSRSDDSRSPNLEDYSLRHLFFAADRGSALTTETTLDQDRFRVWGVVRFSDEASARWASRGWWSLLSYRFSVTWGAFLRAARVLAASCHQSNRLVPTNPINSAMKGPTTAPVTLSQVEPVIRLSIGSSPIL
jgi:hypothetical protein